MTADEALAEMDSGWYPCPAWWHAAISSELSALRKVLVESPIPEHPAIELTPEVREAIEVAVEATEEIYLQEPECHYSIEQCEKAAAVLREMLK